MHKLLSSTDHDLLPRLTESGAKPLFVFLHAPWNPISEVMFATVNRVANTIENRLDSRSAELFYCKLFVDKYNVREIPTYMVFTEGILIGRLTGKVTSEVLFMFIADSLRKNKRKSLVP